MSRRKWTDSEVLEITRRYPAERTQDIANDLGRPIRSVYQKAFGLRLRKSSEYLQSEDSARIGPSRNLGVKSRFKPGDRSWNRGMRYQPGGRAAETQFKPGRCPTEARNYQQIGTRRVRDGQLVEKWTDDQSLPPGKRWKPVSRLIWERVHGPIPKGCVVAFKDGRTRLKAEEIHLDILECITRAENMRRNSYHTRYPEIAPLIQLRGALNRKINTRMKEQQK